MKAFSAAPPFLCAPLNCSTAARRHGDPSKIASRGTLTQTAEILPAGGFEESPFMPVSSD
jgi:hypothetical protein